MLDDLDTAIRALVTGVIGSLVILAVIVAVLSAVLSATAVLPGTTVKLAVLGGFVAMVVSAVGLVRRG